MSEDARITLHYLTSRGFPKEEAINYLHLYADTPRLFKYISTMFETRQRFLRRYAKAHNTVSSKVNVNSTEYVNAVKELYRRRKLKTSFANNKQLINVYRRIHGERDPKTGKLRRTPDRSDPSAKRDYIEATGALGKKIRDIERDIDQLMIMRKNYSDDNIYSNMLDERIARKQSRLQDFEDELRIKQQHKRKNK